MAFKKHRANAALLRKVVLRANTSLLIFTVMLFQFSALLLLTFKTDPIDTQALILAVALPVGTYLVTSILPRIWPIDRALLTLTLFLCSLGIVTLKDIARSPITPRNQAIFVLIGIFAMVAGIVFIRRLRSWEKWTPWLMGLTLLAVASPLVLGSWQGGAKNWIKLGENFSVQPSEFGKVALIVILASSFTRHAGWKSMLITLAFSACCCGLLLIERDLGALLLYFLLTVFLFYVATSNLYLTLAGLGAGAASAVVAYYLFDHVRTRVEIWQNPWADPQDKAYQIVQALIAIGSGGAFGMGLGLGMPRNIPLYHSDFIFAAVSEEFGWIFAVCVLAVYVLIIMRGVSVAMSARTSFHAMTAFGVVAMIGLQTLVIVGGVIKLIPLTGVTLPFVCSGGSSMVACMGMMGMLLGISSINAQDEIEDLHKLEWREAMRE